MEKYLALFVLCQGFIFFPGSAQEIKSPNNQELVYAILGSELRGNPASHSPDGFGITFAAINHYSVPEFNTLLLGFEGGGNRGAWRTKAQIAGIPGYRRVNSGFSYSLLLDESFRTGAGLAFHFQNQSDNRITMQPSYGFGILWQATKDSWLGAHFNSPARIMDVSLNSGIERQLSLEYSMFFGDCILLRTEAGFYQFKGLGSRMDVAIVHPKGIAFAYGISMNPFAQQISFVNEYRAFLLGFSMGYALNAGFSPEISATWRKPV